MSPNAGIDGIDGIDGIAAAPFDDAGSAVAMRGAERLRAGRFRAVGVPAGAAAFLAMLSAP